MPAQRLDEPAVTATLSNLQKTGWIEFEGTSGSIDYWQPGKKGQRLTATRLLKRIRSAEGRQILDRLIEEARAINADPEKSRRIKTIFLFGSLLTGSDDGSIGDIDVVVEIGRRVLSEVERRSLEKTEKASKPAGTNFGDSLHWPEILIRCRLAKVSRYLSFHPASDLQTEKTLYQQVYSFDLRREREESPDTEIRSMVQSSEESSSVQSPKNERYSRANRAWPSAPGKAISVRIDGGGGQLAQHLWMNGASLKAIAARLCSKPVVVQAYLSSRAAKSRSNFRGKVNASLKATLLGSVPQRRSFSALVSVSFQPKQEVVIDISVYSSRGARKQGSLRRVGHSYSVNGSPAELLIPLESLDRAAAAWFDSMRDQFRGLGVEILVPCVPRQRCEESAGAKRVDPSPLKRPLLELLDKLWKEPRDECEGWGKRLSVSLAAEPVVTFQDGRRSDAIVIEGGRSRCVTDLAGALYRKFERTLNDGSSWSVYVTGRVLELARGM